MIKAIIFDLDGTLIQTEILKARSYALSVNTLTKDEVAVQSVLDRFKKYVGLSRIEVAAGIVDDFRQELQKHFVANKQQNMEQWVLTKRLSIYADMVNDPDLLSKYFCNHNLELLNDVFKDKFKVVLATMSHLKEAEKVLKIIGVKEKLDLILTRDNVEEGKPDPEIYLLAMEKLNLKANECIVIEDSVNGIKAGINAGMHVFAVTNSITEESVIKAKLLPDEYIITERKEIRDRVYDFINTRGENL